MKTINWHTWLYMPGFIFKLSNNYIVIIFSNIFNNKYNIFFCLFNNKGYPDYTIDKNIEKYT